MPPTAATAGSAAFPNVESSPCQQLALDLQADEEEEHGHQAVVDPQQQGLVQRQRADAHGHGRVEQAVVEPFQRRVAGDQRGDGGGQQHQPAGRLVVEERRGALESLAHVGYRPYLAANSRSISACHAAICASCSGPSQARWSPRA